MRLICPNCEAQYEVDERVIPQGGRDVQCSNCGHTWFQPAAGEDAPPAADEDVELADEAAPPEPPHEEDRAPEPEPDEDADQDDTPDPDDLAEEIAAAAAAVRSGAQRTGLDSSVKDVLREEAEREAEVRRAERQGLETQPDLGLEDSADDQAARRQATARERAAHLRGTPPSLPPEPMLEDDEDEQTGVAARSRGGLLPDVDEINSTLRSSTDKARGEAAAELQAEEAAPRRRSGFRLGFMVILVIASIGSLVYVFAPKIIEAVPQAEPYLQAYVTWVNDMRVRLDALVESAIAKARELMGSLGGGEGGES